MRINYQTLKRVAKQNKLRVTDLIALAPQNDPFYVGTNSDLANAQWFTSIYRRAGYSVQNAPHLRRVHYWTVSQKQPVIMPPTKDYPNGLPYENTQKCWEYLITAAKAARYLRDVPFQGIRDNKNPTPHQHAHYSTDLPTAAASVPELDNIKPIIEGISIEAAQPYHLELWCEKSTMDDILTPICEDYNVNLVTFEGEVSITSVCVSLMQRIAASGFKPTRIWYISDFDPAGKSMPVAMSRKLEFMLQECTPQVDARVNVLALTAEQVQHYNLPRIPIKEGEKRANKFERNNGAGAAELDALEALYPGELHTIVETAIKPYYSMTAHNHVLRQYSALQQAIKAQTDAILAKYQVQIAALRPMQVELDAVTVDASAYTVDRYEPHVVEDDSSLYSSKRDYPDQLVSYKKHKGDL